MELQQHLIARELSISMGYSQHAAISDIQINALWVLINLITKRPSIKDYVLEIGMLPAIIQVMDLHRLNKDVQHASVIVLSLILKRAFARHEIFNYKGFVPIFNMIQDHGTEPNLLRSAIKSIYRLSFSKQMYKEIGRFSRFNNRDC